MMRFVKAIYWRVYITKLALGWIRQYNIGDQVWFAGRQWTLTQGVCAPTWTLMIGSGREAETLQAHESGFRKVRSLSNYRQSFRSGYRFYMTSWYAIWMRRGIEDWMRGCNIWPGKKRSGPQGFV